MKRVLYLVVFVLFMVACKADLGESFGPYYAINGQTSITLGWDSRYLFEPDNTIGFHLVPKELSSMPLEPSTPDAVLWNALFEGVKKLDKSASALEEFAFNRIIERERPIEEEFQQYIKELGIAGNRDYWGSTFLSIYVRDIPSIVADDVFLGQPAGTDLSDYFIFADENIIDIVGKDWTMVRRGAGKDRKYVAASEFFFKDRMLPLRIFVRSIGVPDEVSLSTWDLVGGGGWNPINLTITIPVTFEHYWDWCYALYVNPKAEERFYDGELKVVVPFVRK